MPARGEAFSFIFEKDSGRSGSRGARRELRARTGGRRVVRERGRSEGLLRARTAMCLCGALSSKPPRARAHTVLNALGLECLSVLCCWWAGEPSDRACAGEGNTEAGEAAVVLTRSVMRWPRPLAVSPSLAGASWWEPDLVVTGGHTHQSAREGKTRGCSKAAVVWTRTVMRWPPVRCIPSSRARVEAPSGKRRPRRVRRRANPQRVRLRHEGGRRCTSARSRSAHNAHRDAHAHTREGRRVVSAHVAPLGCEGRARACMNTHTTWLILPVAYACLKD